MLKFKHKKMYFRQKLINPKVSDLKITKKICHAELVIFRRLRTASVD